MKGKVLVVEDDVYLMEGIRDILELNGYEVITASSGHDGLQVMHNQTAPPDVIVSDIMMPAMNGYEFLTAVRSELNWLDIPFIFLTAKGERADENLSKELGADDFIRKPFEPKDLVIAVDARLRWHQRKRQKHDQQTLETKQKIMTILYHEFNTPLTYVVAYNDMLKQIEAKDLTADTLRTYLNGVDNGATRLRRLVEDFILLVELQTREADQIYLARQHVIHNYEDLVAPLVSELKPEVSAAKQHLSVEIDPNTPPILGYSSYMFKALRCLVDNAIKFGKAGNQITLRIGPVPEGVCFEVSDTGRGIPNDEFQKIFEPFYQINREIYEDQGSGAGLAIVKSVVELHEGEVEVESVVGQGSRFNIYVPAYHM